MLKAQQAQLETSAAPGSLSRTIELFVTGRICLFGEHSDWAGGLCFQQVHRASSKRDWFTFREKGRQEKAKARNQTHTDIRSGFVTRQD